ncbi:MAG: hypothetical protein SNG02_04170 [Rikenellaceae bacterium]
MVNTISRLILSLALFTSLFTSCSDTEASGVGSVEFEATGIFFDKAIYTQNADLSKVRVVTFELDNVETLEVDSYPNGWEVELQFYKNTLIVTAPENITDYDDNGEILLSGETFTGNSMSASIAVGITDFVYIDTDLDMQANSMIVNEAGKFYIFSSTFKGEDKTQLLTGVASAGMLWKDTYCSINHAQKYSDTEIGFYVSSDEYDIDEDGEYTDIKEGSAVIAAYDENEDILWSWHIWGLDDEISEITFNDRTFMDRNLGADYNDIFILADDDLYSTQNTNECTKNSYGLYYQWGRKDPFPTPVTYNCTGGYDNFLVNDYNSSVYISYYETTAVKGRVSYTTEYPTYYLTGVTESNDDWLYSSHNGDLWNDNTKSIYDPSPKGWRVPRSTDFDGVTLASIPPSQTSDGTYSYAAMLQDASGKEELFIGAGRRNYISGRIQNVIGDGNYTPWSGYYWTSGSTTDTKSYCLKFASDESLTTQYAARRANGMQIRCVKNE